MGPESVFFLDTRVGNLLLWKNQVSRGSHAPRLCTSLHSFYSMVAPIVFGGEEKERTEEKERKLAAQGHTELPSAGAGTGPFSLLLFHTSTELGTVGVG